ncbi:MAG: CHAT domain-containing protein [Bacteroidetes bacterium]|nr:CHAT domain-containing protein [Bacteroidota bacterium]
MKSLFILILIASLGCNLYSQDWRYFDSLRVESQTVKKVDSAINYGEKALELYTSAYGENDTVYAGLLRVMMDLHQSAKQFSQAEFYGVKELNIRERVEGKSTANYIAACNNLALLYKELGNYSLAEPLYIEFKELVENLYGKEHEEYAASCNNLATFYRALGRLSEAEPLLIEAREIYEKLFGKEHTSYLIITNNLGGLYRAKGNYGAAEVCYTEVKSIREKLLGNENIDYGVSCNNLALLYRTMGNYSAAEPLYIETKNIFEKLLGKHHPYYHSINNNLALLYRTTGKYDEAEPILLEAKEIYEKIYGKEHPMYAQSCNNLGVFYRTVGKYDEAEPLLIESRELYAKILGNEHYDYARSCTNLGEVLRIKGRYKDAEALLIEAKAIEEMVLGKDHPDYAQSCHNLAVLYDNIGDYNSSKNLFNESIDVKNKNIIKNFTFLSEREKEMYFKTQSPFFSDFYSFAFRNKEKDKTITELVYNNVLRTKGLLLKSSTAMRTAIMSSGDSELIKLYEKWIELNVEISKIYSTEVSKRNIDVSIIEERANEIEKELVKRSQSFSDFDNLQNITWRNVKSGLKKGESAIEFLHFSQRNNNDDVQYYALIIKHNSKCPEMFYLFDESELRSIIEEASVNSLHKINSVYGKNEEFNNKLYNLIWKPMESKLKATKKVFISPSGLLHKISFAAIAKSENVYLCDLYDLNNLSGTVNIAYSNEFVFDKSIEISLFGGVNYNSTPNDKEVWEYLEGTKSEVVRISDILRKDNYNVNFFLENEASEENLKQYSGNILHIATHGFFYPDPEEVIRMNALEIKKGDVMFRGTNQGFGVWTYMNSTNPLMRSGLALAGANSVWSKQLADSENDGVLTAQEVTNLDLSNTGLVVLSACETGLGDIKDSEGVYGLQRAFKMAGAKMIIMSLWQVPDKETEEFMTLFYSNLIMNNDVKASFNLTQKEMRKKYDPFYWAAFVLLE